MMTLSFAAQSDSGHRWRVLAQAGLQRTVLLGLHRDDLEEVLPREVIQVRPLQSDSPHGCGIMIMISMKCNT
eukprot:1613033-Rhodomonas_salina.4